MINNILKISLSKKCLYILILERSIIITKIKTKNIKILIIKFKKNNNRYFYHWVNNCYVCYLK